MAPMVRGRRTVGAAAGGSSDPLLVPVPPGSVGVTGRPSPAPGRSAAREAAGGGGGSWPVTSRTCGLGSSMDVTLAERREAVDDAVDVGGDGLEVAPAARHRQLDGPGDGLVEPGVEQAELVEASAISWSMRVAEAAWAFSEAMVWAWTGVAGRREGIPGRRPAPAPLDLAVVDALAGVGHEWPCLATCQHSSTASSRRSPISCVEPAARPGPAEAPPGHASATGAVRALIAVADGGATAR